LSLLSWCNSRKDIDDVQCITDQQEAHKNFSTSDKQLPAIFHPQDISVFFQIVFARSGDDLHLVLADKKFVAHIPANKKKL